MEQLPDDIKEAMSKCGSLAYLPSAAKAQPYTLGREVRASTHGALLNGTFLSALMGSHVLPAGTQGWLFINPKIHYSRYVQVGDMDLPADDADTILTGCYYTFLTFVELEGGHRVLADYFQATEHEPRVLS